MAVQNLTTNIMRFPFFQMLDNSAEDLFDIGSQTGCNKLEKDNLAVFTLVKYHMDTVKSQLNQAFCLPKECDKEALMRMQTNIHRWIQPYCYEIFIDGILDKEKQINDPDVSTECYIEFVQQKEKLNELREENKTGMEVFLLGWGIYLSIVMAATIYDLLIKTIYHNTVYPNTSNYKKIQSVRKTKKNIEIFNDLIKNKNLLRLKQRFGLKP